MREEIRSERLVELTCEARMPDLQFVAGWLATPDAGIIAPVVEMAAAVSAKATPRRR